MATKRRSVLRTEHRPLAGFPTRLVWAEPQPDVVDNDAPAVLFLHGFSDSADTWRRVQRRLADAGITSLAVDQPSHGEAAPVDTSAPLIPQFVAFAADAARLVGAGNPVVVVGNSLGGAHSLLLAQTHPELVAGVVPIAPAGFDHPRWFSALDPTRNADGTPSGKPRRLTAEAELPRAAVVARRALGGPGMRVVAFGRPWRAPDGFIREWHARFDDPERAKAMRALMIEVPDQYIHENPFDLAAITAPVLGIFGTRDRLVKPSSRHALRADLADVEITVLRGIGHMPQLESPGLTTKYLRRFLDRVRDNGAGHPAPHGGVGVSGDGS